MPVVIKNNSNKKAKKAIQIETSTKMFSPFKIGLNLQYGPYVDKNVFLVVPFHCNSFEDVVT